MSPAAERIRNWREDRGILRFILENFGVTPDPWQEKAALAFASPKGEHRRISLQACAGPGKSAIMAMCGWWFLSTQGTINQHPKGAVTAITGQNLKDNLWAEYAKWQGHSEFLKLAFTWTSNRIFANDHPETWFISARTWPKSATPDEQGATLSGLHSTAVLSQVDEAGAIPTTVLRAAEQALSNCEFGKIMISGNPISLEGMLYAAATQLRHQWFVIRVTGDPDDPNAWVHSPRVDVKRTDDDQTPAEWAREQIDTYGREDPWVKAYILGEFPPASINALLSLEEVEQAMLRQTTPDTYEWAQKRIGIDVARFGDDRTVFAPRQGLVAFKPNVNRFKRGAAVSTDIATLAIQRARKWGAELILIDATGGWAAGARDVMVVAGWPPIEVQMHLEAFDKKYANRRAECWFRFAQWIKQGGCLPPTRELVAELTVPTYTYDGKGRFLLEPKDKVKERIGRSPDIADAYALTFAIPDQPAGTQVAGIRQAGSRQSNRADSDFDPYI